MQRTRRPVRRSSRIKLAGVIAIALLAMAVFAAGAQACSYSDTQQVFSPWGDQRDYVLSPDGGFESGGSGWSLGDGAAVVSGNESFYVNSASDSSSLFLPSGSTATSPAICVGRETPVFRLFALNAGDPSSRLRVSVVYDLPGRFDPEIGRTIRAGADWSPTRTLSTVPGLAELAGTMEVEFTPLDADGSWQVDDLYIDPFARH
jgi:hypothetical protein